MSGKPYKLYLLRCGDGSLYTGIAIDVERRIDEHRQGRRGARYLRGRGPLQLAYWVEAGDRATALRLEHRVKRLKKADKEALVAGRLELDSLFSQLDGCSASE